MSAILLAAALVASPTLIDNATVLLGDGKALERTSILVDGGRIVAVGRGLAAPASARRIDATGKIVTPGLIESLSQLGVREIDLESSTIDFEIEGEPITPGFRVAAGWNPHSARIPVQREEGVTSALVVPRGSILRGLGAWVDLSGTLASRPDPRKPAAMYGSVGHSAAQAAKGARGNAWHLLRQTIDDARYLRKHAGRAPDRPLRLSTLHLEALYPVLDGAIPLVLEAHRAGDILEALAFAREEKLRLVVEGGAEAWMVGAQLAASATPVILVPSQQVPSSFEMLGARDDAPALLERSGVSVLLSAQSGDDNARRLRQEAGVAVAYGMTAAGALAAVCARPAEVFGQGLLRGTIAVGKQADLVIWSGDPFELSTIAEHVFVSGVEAAPATRQRRLAERYGAVFK